MKLGIKLISLSCIFVSHLVSQIGILFKNMIEFLVQRFVHIFKLHVLSFYLIGLISSGVGLNKLFNSFLQISVDSNMAINSFLEFFIFLFVEVDFLLARILISSIKFLALHEGFLLHLVDLQLIN